MPELGLRRLSHKDAIIRSPRTAETQPVGAADQFDVGVAVAHQSRNVDRQGAGADHRDPATGEYREIAVVVAVRHLIAETLQFLGNVLETPDANRDNDSPSHDNGTVIET